MAGYLFFPPADVAQDKIWQYTLETHGEKQAVRYITGLHEYLQNLSEKKVPWNILPRKFSVPADLNIDAYFGKYEHHFIFFRELKSAKIGVMSILHEKMDIPVRLKNDLDVIAQDSTEKD